jgi:hypothetical protein
MRQAVSVSICLSLDGHQSDQMDAAITIPCEDHTKARGADGHQGRDIEREFLARPLRPFPCPYVTGICLERKHMPVAPMLVSVCRDDLCRKRWNTEGLKSNRLWRLSCRNEPALSFGFALHFVERSRLLVHLGDRAQDTVDHWID